MRTPLPRRRLVRKKLFKICRETKQSNFITNKIRNCTTVGDSSSRKFECCLAVWLVIRPETGKSIDVIVVSGIKHRISKHEQSGLVCYQIVVVVVSAVDRTDQYDCCVSKEDDRS